MSDYGEFDLEDTGKSLDIITLGVIIIVGLSILFFFTLARNSAYLFVDALASVFGTLETAHLTILGFTLFTLVAPVGYFWMQDPAFLGLDYGGVTFEPVLISSIITYVVAGLVVGLIAKKDWLKGFTVGIWTGIGVYITTLILTLIALIAVGIISAGAPGVLGTILVVLFILVMSIPSFIICGAAGMLGGLIYQRVLKNRYRI
ncbi:MAG: hypothetical protein ACTSVY_15195 [Candidatus Helarchaeota archaeon]